MNLNELKINGRGVMNTAKNEVFIGLKHENCYLVGRNYPLRGQTKFENGGGKAGEAKLVGP